jgi:glycine cleavage system regulatory protein
MRASLVLTVIGEDRPGIVEHLSQIVAAAEGNWEESRMSRLAGKFAGILRVSVDPSRADQLAQALSALEPKGLRVVVEKSAAEDAGEYNTIALDLVGNDHPGIVRDIAHALATRGINIEELETEVSSAPMSGGELFRARAQLRTPAGIGSAELRAVLEALADDLMVDITLKD